MSYFLKIQSRRGSAKDSAAAQECSMRMSFSRYAFLRLASLI